MRVWKDKVEEEEKREITHLHIGMKLSVYSPTASIPHV